MTTWTAIEDMIRDRWGGWPDGREGNTRSYRVLSPTGGTLLVKVTLGRRWCSLAVDRWRTTDRRTEPSEAWFRQHVWPLVEAASQVRRRGWSILPTGGGDYASASPLDRAVIADLAEAWISHELTWGLPRETPNARTAAQHRGETP
ncbi:hypothetical protein [Dactylosporangium sp. CA-092794]|uniref:hypothetical protein n=1 Tax=Dactylosporangium sp. CA-092794 TaxID=3239929 RepID=UPI003D92B543